MIQVNGLARKNPVGEKIAEVRFRFDVAEKLRHQSSCVPDQFPQFQLISVNHFFWNIVDLLRERVIVLRERDQKLHDGQLCALLWVAECDLCVTVFLLPDRGAINLNAKHHFAHILSEFFIYILAFLATRTILCIRVPNHRQMVWILL